MTAFIEWTDSVAKIRSGVALASMPTRTRKLLIDALGQPAAEAIAVTAAEKGILYTDDFAVAQVACTEIKVARVWTQVVCDWLTAEDRLSADELAQVTIHLVCIGMSFTRIGTDVVVRAATEAAFVPEREPLASFCRYFSDETVTPRAILLLTASVLPLIWRSAALEEQASAATLGLLRALRRRNDGLDMLVALQKDIHKLFGVDALNGDRCERIIAQVIRESQGSGLIFPGEGGLAIEARG